MKGRTLGSVAVGLGPVLASETPLFVSGVRHAGSRLITTLATQITGFVGNLNRPCLEKA